MGATVGGKGFNTALGGVMTGMLETTGATANMAHSRKESMGFLGGGAGFSLARNNGGNSRGVGREMRQRRGADGGND